MVPNLAGAELLAGSRHCSPATDELRCMLSGRIAAFLAEAPAQTAAD